MKPLGLLFTNPGPTGLRTRAVTVLALVAVGALALPNWGCPRPATTGEVRGAITVHGAFIDPQDILVRARPLPGGDEADEKAIREVVVSATRVPGGDASQFEFRLTGLVKEIPYRIGVQVANQDTQDYPRLVWSADRDLLVAADDSPLRLHAYAVTAEIEVMTLEGRERAQWVGADALEFGDVARATRTFRWRTSIPNVTGGQLQISLKPFPRTGEPGYSPCGNGDEGVIYKADFEADVASGEWTAIPPVDFHALLQPRRDGAGKVAAPLPGAVGRAIDDPNWETLVLPKLQAGLPLYARVMPKIGEEILCDPDVGGVPPEALLAQIILDSLDSLPEEDPKIVVGNVTYTSPVIGARPYAGETCYRVTKPHKVLYLLSSSQATVWDTLVAKHMSGVTYGQTAMPGMSFCYGGKSSDGWLEDFADSFGAVLTGIVDAVGDIVNYTSNLWEEIQDAAVDAAASAINEVGIVDCGPGSLCRDALETGLEVGLASMGVPPSLPNFDELVDQGIDYVAAQVASQVGVPEDLVDYASQQAKEFVQKAVEDMQSSYGVPGLPDWLVPYTRFDPAYVVMELYGQGKAYPYDSAPKMIRNDKPVYAGGMVGLPIQLPKQGEEPPLLFPMVLPPNTEGLPAPPPIVLFGVEYERTEYDKAVWYKNQWAAQRFNNPSSCYWFYLTALSDPGGIYKVHSSKFRPWDGSVACEP